MGAVRVGRMRWLASYLSESLWYLPRRPLPRRYANRDRPVRSSGRSATHTLCKRRHVPAGRRAVAQRLRVRPDAVRPSPRLGLGRHPCIHALVRLLLVPLLPASALLVLSRLPVPRPMDFCTGTGAHPAHICTGTGRPARAARIADGPPQPRAPPRGASVRRSIATLRYARGPKRPARAASWWVLTLLPAQHYSTAFL
jgi:hypothetical protein